MSVEHPSWVSTFQYVRVFALKKAVEAKVTGNSLS